MHIEKYISELFFENDCVIIPGFGGFVCNYASARVDPAKQLFYPPFKNISFNRNLTNNDGLLANCISQEEKISYSEANNIISEAVIHLKDELGLNRRYDLKNIGTFYLGEESTILFEQDETVNYLPDSFGLNTFYSPAIKREHLERKIERKLKDQIIIPSKKQNEVVTKKRVSVVRYITITASLLISFSLFFVFLKTDLLNNTSFANLNPFGEDPTALYQPDPAPWPDNDVTKDNIRDLIASNSGNDTTRYLNIMIGGNVPIVVRLQEDKAPVAKVKAIKSQSKGHFHVIGGAFAISENADKFVTKLKQLGYNAVVLEKKLRFVSYGSFTTREKALEAMEKIRVVQDDVWLMMN